MHLSRARGLAHFVEHMAFAGTRRLPPGTIHAFFENLGLTMGADLNASTSYTFTSYRLDLPARRGAELDKSLAVLRDYAGGMLFLPAEVACEARVEVSELNARDSAGRRVGNQMIDQLFAGTLLPERDVGGVAGQLEHATSEALRSFYTKHFQPGRMTAVVVGEIEPAVAIRKITTAFGTMPIPAEPTPPAAVSLRAPATGVNADIISTPLSKGAAIHFLFASAEQADALVGRRRELAQRLATAALHSRLWPGTNVEISPNQPNPKRGTNRFTLDPRCSTVLNSGARRANGHPRLRYWKQSCDGRKRLGLPKRRSMKWQPVSSLMNGTDSLSSRGNRPLRLRAISAVN